MKNYVGNFLRGLGIGVHRNEANDGRKTYQPAAEVYECPASVRATLTGDQVWINGHLVFYCRAVDGKTRVVI